MISATTQATTVTTILRSVRDGACHVLASSLVQVLADRAHQEEGDDVGEDDGDDAAGGGLRRF